MLLDWHRAMTASLQLGCLECAVDLVASAFNMMLPDNLGPLGLGFQPLSDLQCKCRK